MIGYTITEDNGEHIAVAIKRPRLEFTNNILVAIKEHFGYDSVKNLNVLPSELDSSFIIDSFDVSVEGVDEDGEEEIRDFNIKVTSIY